MSASVGLAQSTIQTAVYTILTGDATLGGLSCGSRIYDAVPESTIADFVAIGEFTEGADDTLEDNNPGVGADCTFTIHVYTDDARGSEGYKNSQAIANRIKVLLHNASLSLTGWSSVLCQFEDSVTMRDDDDTGRKKRHHISTYRAIAEAV